MSLKRARVNRQCRQQRRDLVAERWLCECCLKRQSMCVHEIANGPNRELALDDRRLQLATCWPCNSEELTDKGKWPVAWQLGMLRESRPEDFDLDHANVILIVRVSIEEVDSLPSDWWKLI